MHPHPLNTDFRWRPGPTEPSFLRPEQVAAFDRDGYCLVEDAFSPAMIAELAAAIDPWESATTEFLQTQPDGALFIAQAESITFTVHLVARDKTCRTFTSHPSLLGRGCPDLRLIRVFVVRDHRFVVPRRRRRRRAREWSER